MEFEDLRKIWDDQSNKQLYAINEDVLHRDVIQKNEDAKRTARITETGLLIIGFIVSLFMLIAGIVDTSWVYLPQGIIFLSITLYVSQDRKRRQKNAGLSSGSILDELNQAMRINDYEIKRQKTMIWWFFIPTAVAMLFNLFKTSGIYSWAVIILMIAAVSAGRIVQNRSIKPLLSKKNELKALHKLLVG